MDRLFGKELSNLLDQVPLHKQRPLGRVSSKSTRPLATDENAKMTNKRTDKVTNSARHDSKPAKIQYRDEKESGQAQVNDQLVPDYFDECFQFML